MFHLIFYNLGHNCLRLFSPYRKFAYFYDKLHVDLNHVAILKPPLPQLNVELVSWSILPKVVSALFTTLNWGGGEGETKFVLSMFNNFVILAGMVRLKGFVQDCSKISGISVKWKSAVFFRSLFHRLPAFLVLQIAAFLIPSFTYCSFSQLFVLQIPSSLIPGFTHSGVFHSRFYRSGFSHSGFLQIPTLHIPGFTNLVLTIKIQILICHVLVLFR